MSIKVRMRAALSYDSKRRQVKNLLEYSESTSWLRVAVVSTLAFAPSFACVALIELLPLRPPSEGWQANWVYLIRLFLTSFVLSFGLAVQTSIVAPAAGLKIKHKWFIAVGTSIGFICQFILLAHYWRFPVPFFILLGNPGWQTCWYSGLRLVIGVKKWRENPEIKKQVNIVYQIGSIQSVLVILYPAYNAVFLRLHGFSQTASVLMLPIIKYVVKWLFAQALDEVPGATAFGMVSVELFDALYLFKCMQTAGSALSGAALIIIDSVQNIYHLRCLHKHVQDVKQNLARIGLDPNEDVIRGCRIIRLRSVAPAPTSVASESFLENTKLNTSIQGLVSECEHIVIAEFIECAVPMFYSLYLVLLFHSPNAKYYPETRHIDATKLAVTVRNIATYGILEFISLLYMHFLLLRKFDISALHLLANVLERDNAILQSLFTGWLIMVLQFTLEHGGTWTTCYAFCGTIG